MTDFRLKVFLSVANHLSFTKASQELFISQPAISKHIQELESDFETRLFERRGNSIALTASGELLIKHAEELMEQYQHLEYAMHLLHGDYVGELKLGASTTIAQYVLPPILARFIELHPKVKLSLISGNTREIEEAVETHRIDLGLIEGIYRRTNLKYTPFLEDQLITIARKESALNIPNSISINDLNQYPLILREQGSGTLDVIQRAFTEKGIKLKNLKVPLYLGSTESIKLFIQHSDALGIVSTRAVKSDITVGRFREIEIQDIEMNREFSFVSLQGEIVGLPAVFISFASQYKKKL
ncbi:transcriptional regulator, LysR family [Bacteroides coprosuis DSM 18011]|uniref:Transcriptional regulator, LysR family n=1 Tax=Bacteroides coprosuis DSM 18011 TaxID=679937 RepID=F3ZTM8_9BACE|nr:MULTISPECIES: LysR family transcriptional regulator [Bacteroides]EGJ71259.1 transcriptional regulator, LysR family [Bacteroides coprosuis DSM 18011]HJD93010.1 LysR family transcriptional regulator [Bacteroides coprosuis]